MTSVFCNVCFESDSGVHKKFFVSSCYHVFGDSCIENLKNHCPICNEPCNLIAINKEMPSEVKMFFDSDSFRLLFERIAQITNFVENQAKMYSDHFRGNLVNSKDDEEEIKKFLQDVKTQDELLKREEEIMKQLATAYKNGNITEDLFRLSSSAKRTGMNNSVANLCSSRAGPPSRSVSDSPSPAASLSSSFASNFAGTMNLNRSGPASPGGMSPASQKIDATGSQRGIPSGSQSMVHAGSQRMTSGAQVNGSQRVAPYYSQKISPKPQYPVGESLLKQLQRSTQARIDAQRRSELLRKTNQQ